MLFQRGIAEFGNKDLFLFGIVMPRVGSFGRKSCSKGLFAHNSWTLGMWNCW